VLRFVAVCCIVLQHLTVWHTSRHPADVNACVAACCSVLQSAAVSCIWSRCVAVCCSVWQCETAADIFPTQRSVAACCSVLQRVAVCCSVLQCVASHHVLYMHIGGSEMLFVSGYKSITRACYKFTHTHTKVCVAVCRSVLHFAAVCCSLQC